MWVSGNNEMHSFESIVRRIDMMSAEKYPNNYPTEVAKRGAPKRSNGAVGLFPPTLDTSRTRTVAVVSITVALLVCGFSAGPVAAGVPTSFAHSDVLNDFIKASPQCSESVETCVPIVLYITLDPEGFAQTPQWFAAQMAVAQDQFAKIGVGFQLIKALPMPTDVVANGVVQTRADRDRLGENDRIHRGVVSVFVVHELHDVDQDGMIRGVHWRHQTGNGQRWIIVSKIAPGLVLAHELGHFFGLPRSKEAASLMNKTPRDTPPSSEWTFTDKEQKIMKKRTRAMLKTGFLSPIRP